MTKHAITLDGIHTVTKGPRDGAWKVERTIDLSALSTDIVAKLAVHGLQQKVADAAAGAKTQAEAEAAMDKAIKAILAGEWSSRVAGEGVSEQTRVERQTVRELFKVKVGGKSEAWATFTGLSDADQAARLDAMFAKNEAALRPVVDEKLAELAAARARKAKLATSFNI